MAWFISKNNGSKTPVNLNKLYHPIKNNWVCRVVCFTEDEPLTLKVGNSVSIVNDEIVIHYVGIIREIIIDNYQTHIIITGQSINGSVKKTVQKKNSTAEKIAKEVFGPEADEALEVAAELEKHGLSGGNVLDYQAIEQLNVISQKTKSFIANHNLGKLIQLGVLEAVIGVTNYSQITLGEQTEVFDIEKYKFNAISVSSDHIEVPLQSFKLCSNITAIEYRETSTVVWL